jgi:hypothetical protein
LVFLSVPIANNIVEAQNTTNKAGIRISITLFTT